MKRKGLIIFSTAIILLFISVTFFVFYAGPANDRITGTANILSENLQTDTLFLTTEKSVIRTPHFRYGFNTDSLRIIEGQVKSNESVSEILLKYDVSHQQIFKLASSTKDVFDVRKINPGKNYALVYGKDSSTMVTAFVYEPSRLDYIVYHLGDSVYAEKKERKIEIRERTLSGIITHSLSVTMEDLGVSQELTNRFVDIFAWNIDFFALQKGDMFKIVYSEKLVEGEVVGLNEIKSVYFQHFGNDYRAFAFDQGGGIDYFDEQGVNLRKTFLKYPVEFTRISSRYTRNRFHPVQKRWKAHLGTDFAAPSGTPIRAASEGIVTEAQYKKYNGNYVKIKHNGAYSTQYLHMSKIASGIKHGVKVKQGQVIGFVGATGLATGSHLCYRFWKNGVQVDGLKVELPAAEPVKEDYKEDFNVLVTRFNQQLDSIQAPVEKEIFISTILNP
ncbi:MAG: peptidoglycan DD-metalloendopeptidase family protein [Cyclobacteriaceae bacterium]|nr:peptidoglycan DD-metalloendopeptidase family protein [Cyclobacteriaceae bacterium]